MTVANIFACFVLIPEYYKTFSRDRFLYAWNFCLQPDL